MDYSGSFPNIGFLFWAPSVRNPRVGSMLVAPGSWKLPSRLPASCSAGLNEAKYPGSDTICFAQYPYDGIGHETASQQPSQVDHWARIWDMGQATRHGPLLKDGASARDIQQARIPKAPCD